MVAINHQHGIIQKPSAPWSASLSNKVVAAAAADTDLCKLREAPSGTGRGGQRTKRWSIDDQEQRNQLKSVEHVVLSDPSWKSTKCHYVLCKMLYINVLGSWVTSRVQVESFLQKPEASEDFRQLLFVVDDRQIDGTGARPQYNIIQLIITSYQMRYYLIM